MPDTKINVSVVTLSTDDNRKLLQQLKSRFKPTKTGIKTSQEQQYKILQTNI